MAILFITEFRGVAASGAAVTQAPMVPPVAEQRVTFTSSTASAAFDENTAIVGIMADADCHIAWGSDPTATTANMKIPANNLLYFGVRPGKGDKIAAIVA